MTEIYKIFSGSTLDRH